MAKTVYEEDLGRKNANSREETTNDEQVMHGYVQAKGMLVP